MVVQPTDSPDTDSIIENPGTGTDDLSSLVPAALLAPDRVPSVAPVETQLRTLRVLDADTAVVVESASDEPEELALDEDVVVDGGPLLPELDLIGSELSIKTASAAEEHSHASPPPLTEPGQVIELLSGTEALAAMDALAPFKLPEGYEDGSADFLPARGEYAPIIIASATPDGQAGDLIFLDFTPFAKPENPGNGNGGGKGGGGDDGGGGAALSEYLSGDPVVDDALEYNILIDFKGAWDSYAYLQDAFIWSADWISNVILGDIQDVFYRGKVIDDIKISAELTDIDGTGGVLGQAGPTAIRTDGYLPATGVMEFDIADADYFNSLGLWDDIVVHEMLHTVGFGTIWDYLELVDGSGTDNPTFIGTEAMLAYADLLQSDDPVAVPLEEDGGPGTVESHWDEETFDNEIMTGYIDGSNEMTDLTVASLSDLGYDTVDWANFTEFTV